MTKKLKVNAESSYCRRCQKVLGLYQFYKTTNPMIDKNGYLSVCKECCNELYEHYFALYNQIDIALEYVCRDLDVRFTEDALTHTLAHIEKIMARGSEPNRIFGYYKSKLESTVQANIQIDSFRYHDSDRFQEEGWQDMEAFEITPEMRKFWGKHLSSEDVEFLETEKPHWFDRYKCDTRGEEILYKQICFQILDITRAREKGEDAKKIKDMLDTLQKLMDSANVKPKDANALMDAENIDSFGIRIRDIELYDPAEYFEDKNLYRDFSKMEPYFRNWVLRPLKNLLKGTRDFEIEEEGDTDGTL